MISRLIDRCIANPGLVLLAVLAIVIAGVFAVFRVPLDAIPDLSENQVIIMAEYQGRGPQIVEDQVTYPITTALRGLPGMRAVRGQSMFGLSMVFAIFEDDVDVYWARTRVMERLQTVTNQLPQGVMPMMGPDGTGVGHVYWYHLSSKTHDLAALRSIQDWYLKPALSGVEGVAEVASVGGFVRQYQVNLNPEKMAAAGVTMDQVIAAVRGANNDVGGRILEVGEREVTIRGLGYVRSTADLETTAVATRSDGVPITLNQIGYVQLGSQQRRGLIEADGKGEVAGGIIVMRYGENAKTVIDRVKAEIERLKPGLPEGVTIEMSYDRSDLIERAVATLKDTLIEEMIIVALVILLFLWHARSAIVVILTIPVGVLIAYILMHLLGITSNIMSLGGIAVAIGAMVDAAIVMVENGYRNLSEAQAHSAETGQKVDRLAILSRAARQVGRPLFFSLLVMVLSFLPVFLLTGQEGKMFKPLAWTKSFALIGSTVLAVTLVPVLMVAFIRGRLRPDSANPVASFFSRLYTPVLRWCLHHPWLTLGVNGLALIITIPMITGILMGPIQIRGIGSEFMPALDEGDLLYMPTTLPNVSINEARRIVQVQDYLIKKVPEVEHVLGKVGRAETATDAAPITMIESIVRLKPHDQWRPGMTRRKLIAELDSMVQIPGVTNAWTMPIINRINMLSTGIRTDVGVKIFGDDLHVLDSLALHAEMILRQVPGAADVYTERNLGGIYMDIEIDRAAVARYGLSVAAVESVIETAIGGSNVTQVLEGRARYPVQVRYAPYARDQVAALQRLLVAVPGGVATRSLPGLAVDAGSGAQITTGYTNALAGFSPATPGAGATLPETYAGTGPAPGGGGMEGGMEGSASSSMASGSGMSSGAAPMPAGGGAMGGGDAMSGGASMGGGMTGGSGAMTAGPAMGAPAQSASPLDLFLSPAGTTYVPLGQLARITMAPGPSMIQSENGLLRGTVMLNIRNRDMGGFVAEAKRALSEGLKMPPGYQIMWSGQWENQERATRSLQIILPVVFFLIYLLLYVTFKSWTEALVVLLSVPFALIGGIFLLYAIGFNFSVAVWVGFIALFGVAVETGVVMVVYLHEALDHRLHRGNVTPDDIEEATEEGAVLRLRPKLMTVATSLLGLIPLMWATGSGADFMKPIAVPMIGGMITSAIHVLLVTPVIFILMKNRALKKGTLRTSGMQH